MYTRKVVIVLIVVLGVLLLGTVQVGAGGWATVTLSELPQRVVAERPFTIEFAVRQHGQHLLTDLEATVTAVHWTSGQKVTTQAQGAAKTGFYSATLTLPQAGEWSWEIAAFTAVYPMPPLTVQAISFETTNRAATAVAWPLLIGFAALAGAGLAALFWRQQPSRSRLAGAVLLGIVGLSSLGLHGQTPPPAQAKNEATIPAIAPEAVGEALFVAKGCIQCHQNGRVQMADNLAPIGPALTSYQGSPEFLRLWLADPTAVKPKTEMPNLGLSEAEIESLVSFLSAEAN